MGSALQGDAVTRETVARIIEERLDRWSEILLRNLGTPIVLLAVGNDPDAPQPFICMIDGISDKMLCNLLFHVIAQLQNGDVKTN